MLYCVNKDKVEKTAGAKTAGKKAPDDITELTCMMGGERISFTQDNSTIKPTILRKARNIYCSYKDWNGLFRTVQNGDVIVIQHPYEGIQAGIRYIPKIQKKGVLVICLIHDVRALRDSIDEKTGPLLQNQSNNGEIRLLSMCDYVISHNSSMKKFLADQFGLNSEKIYELGIFDYLCSTEKRERQYDKSIAIAGNLSSAKSSYLYKMLDKKILSNPVHLYGPNYNSQFDNVTYHGIVPPNELPAIMEGSFGLVWDGDELDRCGGVAGEYLKYNNPHKCSLYLAAGLPVIIWREAALAEFVFENDCGIIVDSLYDVSRIINDISDDQYFEYAKNAERIKKKIVSGEYYTSIIKEILGDN